MAPVGDRQLARLTGRRAGGQRITETAQGGPRAGRGAGYDDRPRPQRLRSPRGAVRDAPGGVVPVDRGRVEPALDPLDYRA